MEDFAVVQPIEFTVVLPIVESLVLEGLSSIAVDFTYIFRSLCLKKTGTLLVGDSRDEG
jgi:hypothetical protein